MTVAQRHARHNAASRAAVALSIRMCCTSASTRWLYLQFASWFAPLIEPHAALHDADLRLDKDLHTLCHIQMHCPTGRTVDAHGNVLIQQRVRTWTRLAYDFTCRQCTCISRCGLATEQPLRCRRTQRSVQLLRVYASPPRAALCNCVTLRLPSRASSRIAPARSRTNHPGVRSCRPACTLRCLTSRRRVGLCTWGWRCLSMCTLPSLGRRQPIQRRLAPQQRRKVQASLG